jgi:hypothetical protein
MASKYAYYIRGDQIAIIESKDGEWDSPQSSIEDGIRVEYSGRPKVYEDSSLADLIASDPYTGDYILKESYFIDMDPYLAKALVYYLKGRIAEDQGEIEAKEYFMREFRAMVIRHNDGKVYGKRTVFPPSQAII